MLLAIGHPDNVPAYIAAVKRREKVLSGFGHRCVAPCSISHFWRQLTVGICTLVGCTRLRTRDRSSSVISQMKSSPCTSTFQTPLFPLLTPFLTSFTSIRTGRDELLETAMALHDIAIKDEYFVSRKLAPNVDFWSGLIYRAMGFPMDFFPVLFAVPRVVGWLAHWRQMMHQEGGVKIWRPRQVGCAPKQ